jgi:hypothetical protein
MPLRSVVFISWSIFAAVGLIASVDAEHGSRSARFSPPGLLILVAFVFTTNSLLCTPKSCRCWE